MILNYTKKLLHRKPRKPLSMIYSGEIAPQVMVAEAMKQGIIDTLVKHGRLSYEELQKRCAMLQDMTDGYIRGWLNALIREGEITETKQSTKNGPRRYYDLAY